MKVMSISFIVMPQERKKTKKKTPGRRNTEAPRHLHDCTFAKSWNSEGDEGILYCMSKEVCDG